MADTHGGEGNFTYFNDKINDRGEMRAGNTGERGWNHYLAAKCVYKGGQNEAAF